MEHEHVHEVDLHHVVHVPDEEPGLRHLCEHRPLGQPVHVLVADPRADGPLHRQRRLPDGFVYGALLRRERPRHRIRAGHVGRVAVVLRAHVAQSQAARLHRLWVRLSGVAIVQDGVALAGRADAVIAYARAAAEGGVVAEGGLCHVLAHAAPHSPHDLDMRLAGHVVGKLQDLELVRRLDHSRLGQLLPERSVGIGAREGQTFETLEVGRPGGLA
mmetsp:Transcript_124187/g.362435  ORF Transcript_124187/g.362435 Transcript_124187/m.362435 type:complete len:216 (-) Transcript_124187:564-1211(-)